MSRSLDDDLRAALRTATAPITAPPDLAALARAAADRRRRRHTHVALVLAPVAVVGVLAAAVLVVPRIGTDRAALPAADQVLLDRPTGGDLAGDARVRAGLVAAFERGVRPAEYRSPSLATPPPGTRPAGDPRVVWAGSTPDGVAGVVVQREDGPGRPALAVGYVGPGVRGPELVAVSRSREGYDRYAGAYVGPDYRTVLVLDPGAPLTWSYQHDYRAPAGVVLRDRPVRFDGGVAVLTVPVGVNPAEVAVTRPGGPDLDRLLPLGNSPGGGPFAYERLPWSGDKRDGPPQFPVAGAARWPAPGGPDGRVPLLAQAFRTAVAAVPSDRWLTGSAGDELWYAYGATPDGRRLVATDAMADGDPTRAYAVLIGPGDRSTVVDGGPVDPDGRVPFRVRLPDGQGWLLAAKGRTLTWTDGGRARTARDAALLPAGATEVRADGTRVALR